MLYETYYIIYWSMASNFLPLGWLWPCRQRRRLSSLNLPAQISVIAKSAGPTGACHHSRQLPLPGWSCQYSNTHVSRDW